MELDDAYNNRGYIDDAEAYPPRWAAQAQAYRDRVGVREVRYGSSARQVADLFMPQGTPQGLVMFVHGGYWRLFDRSYWSEMAEGARATGWAVAMPSYDLCPDIRIADITVQITAAVHRLANEIEGPIRLVGHSAGAHLVARMLAPGQLPVDVVERIARVIPISPVSDLRPLLQTSMNADFKLDAASAAAESPLLQPRPETPVTVWVGGDERPAFRDQARWLAEAWKAEHVVDPGKHHFNVIEALADPDSALTAAVLA